VRLGIFDWVTIPEIKIIYVMISSVSKLASSAVAVCGAGRVIAAAPAPGR
jgi:hypothetical protein